MVRPPRYPNLPPVSPVQFALVSSPPPWPPKPRALPMSPAHVRSLLLAAARPRYPISYIAISPNPRPLSLALKLAAAPRDPGPIRITPSNRYIVPDLKSPTLDRYKPLSFEKNCPCPLGRRCGNWRPTPPMPKYYMPSTNPPRNYPLTLRNRVMRTTEPRNVKALFPMSTLTKDTCHALRKRVELLWVWRFTWLFFSFCCPSSPFLRFTFYFLIITCSFVYQSARNPYFPSPLSVWIS